MSKIDPAKIGNTNQSSPRKHWFITLKVHDSWNRSNSSNLKSWLKEHTTSSVWQIEKGEDTGYLHIQLTMELMVKKRFTWLKRHFNDIAHIEPCHNINASYDYCSKSETRIEGPYIMPEPLGVKDILDPLKGFDYYPYQQRIVDIITGPVDPRKIYWFWEPIGNVGKSDFCLHCILNHDVIVFDGAKKDILHAYNGEKIVFFDLSRTCENYVSYDAIEQLKKGFCFSTKYESKMKVYNKPHVIIFANFEPDVSKLSLDRWDVTEITPL